MLDFLILIMLYIFSILNCYKFFVENFFSMSQFQRYINNIPKYVHSDCFYFVSLFFNCPAQILILSYNSINQN